MQFHSVPNLCSFLKYIFKAIQYSFQTVFSVRSHIACRFKQPPMIPVLEMFWKDTWHQNKKPKLLSHVVVVVLHTIVSLPPPLFFSGTVVLSLVDGIGLLWFWSSILCFTKVYYFWPKNVFFQNTIWLQQQQWWRETPPPKLINIKHFVAAYSISGITKHTPLIRLPGPPPSSLAGV